MNALKKVIEEAGQPTTDIGEFCEKPLQLPMSEKRWARLRAILAKTLISVRDQQCLVQCFLQLATGGLLEEVIAFLLTLPIQARETNFVLSVALQYTDKLNFKILKFYSDHAEQLDPLKRVSGSEDLRVIFRLFDA